MGGGGNKYMRTWTEEEERGGLRAEVWLGGGVVGVWGQWAWAENKNGRKGRCA